MKNTNGTIEKIEMLFSAKRNAVIAIDGCCASGKTTFAEMLSERTGAQVIHMDDFFLPPEMRTAQRLSQPGGNIHYERFIDEVIGGIRSGKPFEYRIFKCSVGDFCGKAEINPQKPIIIEGAYALHPEIPDIYDKKIFLTVSPETQLRRIRERNGEQTLKAFEEKWIPLENRYFSAFGIKEKSDIVINNE
ncbi:MAG: uridine kinase [Acutalibacteraceae bacterium]